jgi:hypothetical protein
MCPQKGNDQLFHRVRDQQRSVHIDTQRLEVGPRLRRLLPGWFCRVIHARYKSQWSEKVQLNLPIGEEKGASTAHEFGL